MRGLLMELLAKVSREDPVCGKWHVPPVQKCRIWCDASHLALGVVLEVQDRECLFKMRLGFARLKIFRTSMLQSLRQCSKESTWR